MTKMNGWSCPGNAKKWHYFNNDIVSLCRRWMFAGNTEPGQDEHPDNCKACQKAKGKLDKQESSK